MRAYREHAWIVWRDSVIDSTSHEAERYASKHEMNPIKKPALEIPSTCTTKCIIQKHRCNYVDYNDTGRAKTVPAACIESVDLQTLSTLTP